MLTIVTVGINLVLIFFAYVFIKKNQQFKRGILADGVVVDVEIIKRVTGSRGEGRTRTDSYTYQYFPIVEYKTRTNNLIRGQSAFNHLESNSPKKGDSVQVLYDPQNESQILFANLHKPNTILVQLLVVLLAMIFTWFLYFKIK